MLTGPAGTAAEATLRSLAERYARAVDRRDPELFICVFHSDARLRVYNPGDSAEPVSDLSGHDEIGTVPQLIGVYPKTFHFIGNATYEISDGRATGEVYCVAHHLTPDRHGGTAYLMYIRYQDAYRAGPDGEWRIADRRVLVDWTATQAANPADR
jgi:hypothetical protein